MGWNIFRILADCSHLVAKCILIFSIHRNRSSEGVSLLTQAFYGIVFVTRYTDVFIERNAWNYTFKIFYLLSSFYTVTIMRFAYPRTREKEFAWKMSAGIVAAAVAVSPFAMMIFEDEWSFNQFVWVFSEVLESVCVLPQLLLLRQTTVPTVITSFYIVFLGSYRALYLVNWVLRAANADFPDGVSVVFGIVQTALYADFAWVYWTRQRVKLRNGGVVDADDLRNGWLLGRIFGKHADADGIDEESAPALGGPTARNGQPGTGRGAPRAKWGARGISISADDDLLDRAHQQSLEQHGVTDGADPDAKMRDPDELARVLDEEDEGDAPPAPAGPRVESGGTSSSGVRGGDEWNDA